MTNTPERPDHKTRFPSLGVGTKNKQQSISVQYPHEADKILRRMDNRSEYIRNAVIRQMINDGLLDEDFQAGGSA